MEEIRRPYKKRPFTSNISKIMILLLLTLVFITALPNTAFAGVAPPSMTASFAANGSVNVNTGDSAYAKKITDVKIDGAALPNAFDEMINITNANLNIDAYCFQSTKAYTITIIATGYNNATVTASNLPLSPPSMTASFAANGSVNVNTGDSAYAKKITDVKIDGAALPNAFDEMINITNANLNIDAYCFQSTKAYTITIIATGYNNATVSVSNVLSPPSMYVFPFIDIAKDAWYRNDVMVAHKNGLINGITPNTFVPNNNMTIGEAVKLAACMHQLYHDGSVTLTNGTPQWYSSYVTYSLEKDIISGPYSDYNKKITRSEFVNIFYNALPVSQYGVINMVSNGAIPDVTMSSQYANKIYAFYRAGILVGSDSKGNFYPSSNILRSEVAAVLSRMFDDTVRKSITLN